MGTTANLQPTARRQHTPAISPGRIALLDAWRGAAIIGVVLYHLGWDLSFFGYAPPDMMYYDPMIVFARTLAGSFMFLCGVGLVLAHSKAFDQKGFIRRLSKIALSALAITVVTVLLMSDVFVYFGILHAIAASSLLGLIFLRLPIAVIVCAAIIVLLLGLKFQFEVFDTRWLAWIGFASNPPSSNDFVPLFPWFGIVLFGIAAARLSEKHRELYAVSYTHLTLPTTPYV